MRRSIANSIPESRQPSPGSWPARGRSDQGGAGRRSRPRREHRLFLRPAPADAAFRQCRRPVPAPRAEGGRAGRQGAGRHIPDPGQRIRLCHLQDRATARLDGACATAGCLFPERRRTNAARPIRSTRSGRRQPPRKGASNRAGNGPTHSGRCRAPRRAPRSQASPLRLDDRRARSIGSRRLRPPVRMRKVSDRFKEQCFGQLNLRAVGARLHATHAHQISKRPSREVRTANEQTSLAIASV
jgi:hypothetical protein